MVRTVRLWNPGEIRQSPLHYLPVSPNTDVCSVLTLMLIVFSIGFTALHGESTASRNLSLSREQCMCNNYINTLSRTIADFIRTKQGFSRPLLEHKPNNKQPAWANETKIAAHALLDLSGPGENNYAVQ